MNNIYVFKIGYINDRDYLLKEIENGRLRQGWGAMFPGKKPMAVFYGKFKFVQAWKDNWPLDETAPKTINDIFSQLLIMTDFKEGDILIVPNMPENNNFKILKVVDSYCFEHNTGKEKEIDDYRHIVPVNEITTVSFDYDSNSRIISKEFSSNENNIYKVDSEEVIDAVKNLIG
ncbi:hypothetical protein [Miniphocaeibacter halophilus]|uniref:Uncharacterized protein n=1 Tax=Miniphocaeibacter halophilus TaxID=2931922 RepID=A0AC61MST6_9FIRM|nr:hypothetical protein [Miniphocaeibacter halophilus]QQK07859.1 hypothetical protein JFY71_11375 [Miniphocaeibacter halophilus]